MKKIKTFFHIFINSLLPNDHYYQRIAKTRLLFSIKYFFTLMLVLNIFLILILFSRKFYFNNLYEFKTSLINSLNNYPQDLIITLKNNRLTTNYNRPYIMWFNYKNVPYPILAIDERADFEKIHQYDSAVLFTEKGMVIKYNNKLTINQFKHKNKLIIDKKAIEDFKNLTYLIFKLLPLFILFLAILVFFILLIYFSLTKILYLGLISLIIFIMLKIFIKKSSYKKVLQISFHSSTTPIVLEFLTLGLGLRIKFPFWYPFLILIFLSFAVYEVFLSNYNQSQELPHKFHPSIRKHSRPKFHIKKHVHK